ncbi:pirin family protein [Gorillibacterium sp. sgz5001074]|uniref:pirin family protein n=1 Tax=Gorillibacterium sp. sgz5001074 TaxID=3446695 RepID=UPI003F664ABC
MQPRIYSPAMQGRGAFDGGRILEQKPIGFPGEGAVVKRVGPLFYWAWATSTEDAMIGLHPHQGFEIMTYVVEGAAFHGDTLGTNSTVGTGGVQLMKTGSGVSHQERISARSELFQIWFEPDLSEAVRRQPTYEQYEDGEFPSVQASPEVRIKTVIGDGAPVKLTVDARMWDMELEAGSRHRLEVPEGYSLAALAIRGQGTLGAVDALEPAAFGQKDFIFAPADSGTAVDIRSTGSTVLRLVVIQVPTTVSYPLYPKRA